VYNLGRKQFVFARLHSIDAKGRDMGSYPKVVQVLKSMLRWHYAALQVGRCLHKSGRVTDQGQLTLDCVV
jgi:hypothetical protein